MDEMASGAEWAAWHHLSEALRFITALDHPQEISDAIVLEGRIVARGENKIELREILRLGPPQLRNKRRRDAAICRFVDFGHAAEIMISGRSYLALNSRVRA